MAEAWADKACQKNNHHGIRLEERILKKNGDQKKPQNPIFAEEGALAPDISRNLEQLAIFVACTKSTSAKNSTGQNLFGDRISHFKPSWVGLKIGFKKCQKRGGRFFRCPQRLGTD